MEFPILQVAREFSGRNPASEAQLAGIILIEGLATAVGNTAVHRLETTSLEVGLVTQPERVDGIFLVSGK